MSSAVSASEPAVTVTSWPRFQLSAVKMSEVWAPVMLASASTVTSALSLAMVTVTASEGATARPTV